MTTDPFTEAAVDAAEDARKRALDGPPNGAYDGHFLLGFRMGADWARVHLEAQEPSDAEVRAAAFAVMSLDADRGLDGFTYSAIALAALSAARAARRDEEKR